MEIRSQQKGKLGELWVFGKLLDAGVNVYLPLVDEEGIDAIIRRRDTIAKLGGYYNRC